METIEGLKGKLTRVMMAMENAEVKYIKEIINDIARTKLVQDMTNGGEEAVRALGFQQGIGIINMLPDVLESQIKHMEAVGQAQIKSRLGIK